MKKITFQITLISSVYILFLLLAGCVENPERATTNKSTTMEVITEDATPGATISQTPSSLPSATIPPTPTLYRSLTITNSSTPTSLPSLTPLPTSPNPQTIIDQLYERNGNCKLPCWWGFTPGKTSLDQFRQFFEHLGIQIENVSDQTYSVAAFSPGHEREGKAYTIIKTKNGIVEEIQITSDMAAYGGFITTTMLRDYGKPDTVYYSPQEPQIFFLYNQQHILAVYQLANWKVGNGTSLCFLGFNDIFTWSEEGKWSKERIGAKYSIGLLENSDETTDPQFQKYYARLLTGDDYLCSQIN